MELDAAQIDDPGEPGRIVDYHLFRGSARRKSQRYRTQPRRPPARRTLLIKHFALCPVDETFQNQRTILDSGESARRDR